MCRENRRDKRPKLQPFVFFAAPLSVCRKSRQCSLVPSSTVLRLHTCKPIPYVFLITKHDLVLWIALSPFFRTPGTVLGVDDAMLQTSRDGRIRTSSRLQTTYANSVQSQQKPKFLNQKLLLT